MTEAVNQSLKLTCRAPDPRRRHRRSGESAALSKHQSSPRPNIYLAFKHQALTAMRRQHHARLRAEKPGQNGRSLRCKMRRQFSRHGAKWARQDIGENQIIALALQPPITPAIRQ